MHLGSITLRADQYPTHTHYPFCLEMFQKTHRLTFTTAVTLFVGENGTGKSTLLRGIARRCNVHIWKPEENLRLESNPFEEALHRFMEVQWHRGPVPGSYFDSELSRNFALYLEEWASSDPGILEYFGGRSLLTQSHGQALMAYFTARYQVRGLHLLDEPETALSPRSQLELLALLARTSYSGRVQYIIATHSPILLACPGATLYSFDQAPVRRVAYEDTDHYHIYRRFMADRGPFFASEHTAAHHLASVPRPPPGDRTPEDRSSREP